MLRVKDQEYLYRRGDQFYFRRKVPKGLEWAFDGKPQVAISLKTSSRVEARHNLAKENARFEKAVAEAKGELLCKAASQIASATADGFAVTNELVTPTKEHIERAVRAWLAHRLERVAKGDAPAPSSDQGVIELSVHELAVQRGLQARASEPAQTTVWLAETLAGEHGWVIEPGSDLWQHLVLMVGRGQIEADNWLKQDFDGAPRSILDSRFSADQYRLDADRARDQRPVAPVSLEVLMDQSIAEKQLSPATVKVWKRHLKRFIAFIGHDDATKVTETDVVAWKEALLVRANAEGERLSRRTIRDSYLAAIKGLFAWAVENHKIETNPAARVRLVGKTRGPKVRDRGLTDSEATAILSATLEPASPRLSPERALAMRWVPWICAYTGARVNEITQLRGEDISQEGGIWTIHITPEAGSIKNGEPRTVALHSHLIEQGCPSSEHLAQIAA